MMHLKIVFIYCFILFATHWISAQQLPIFGQYRENHGLINPASIGDQYWTQSEQFQNSIGITARRQWTGLSDGPVTFTARYETVIPEYGTVLGINLISDKTGPTSQKGGQIRYAYMLLDNNGGSGRWLSVGISGGFYQWQYHADQAILRDAGDVLGLTNVSNSFADVNAGVFYAAEIGKNNKLFYCGFSALQAASIRFSDNVLTRSPHFYGSMGFYFKNITKDGDEFFTEPSVWVRYVPNTPVQADLTCRFHTPSQFWVGLGQSLSVSGAGDGKTLKGNNLLFEVGFTTGEVWAGRDLRIGLGYQRSFTRFGGELGNTFELNVTTAWKK